MINAESSMYGSNLRRSRIGIVFVPVSEKAYGCSTDVMFTIAKAKGSISNNDLDGVEQMGYFLIIDGKIMQCFSRFQISTEFFSRFSDLENDC